MADSSPVPNNSNNDPAVVATTTPSGAITPLRTTSFDIPKQNLRGLNKPKCIKCGNVARSRCPFQSCKSCCAKAQNPCHIHVLKLNGTLPDKPPPSSSPLPEQPSNTVTPSTGAALRLSSLRQLSSTFANSLRTKRPLSRKDAANINKWRFTKLKEHIEGNIEVENEAFDRYMQNVSLLEETFFLSPQDGFTTDGLLVPEPSSSEDEFSKLVAGIKVGLKSNAERANNFRERLRGTVDQGLKKLQKWEFHDGEGSQADDLDGHRELEIVKLRAERTAAVNDLIDKLIKARSEDDLKSCLEMKLQLFNQDGNMGAHKSSHQIAGDVMETEEASDTVSAIFSYSQPKLCSTVQINQDTLSNIDKQFSSLEQIAEL